MKFFSSLKNRLQVMVLVALLPVLALILYADLRHRRSIAVEVRNSIRHGMSQECMKNMYPENAAE